MTAADRERVLTRAREIEGWLTDAQAARLWDAAARATGPIVEIGSFRGRSTIVLASAAPVDLAVTAIDPHLGGDRGPQEYADDAGRGDADHAAFTENLSAAGVQERVRHVRLRSQDALAEVPGPVSVLYVDGAHRPAPAATDLRRWGARVGLGGTLLVHDAFSSVGVTLALFAVVVGRGGWRYAGRDGSLAEYRRGPRLTATEKTTELGAAAAALPWFMRNLALKAAILARLRHDPWPY